MAYPPLRPYQARVLRALMYGVLRVRNEQFTVLMPRQSGKNQVSAALVAGLLRAHARRGGSIVVCAPTYRPQAAISLERTRALLDATAAAAGIATQADDNRLRCGRASATFLSASGAAQVAGHTASVALIADEAQDIDQEWFDRQFRPMTSSTGAPAVLFGTPWDGASPLERAVEHNRGRASLGVPLHHEVSWREVARSNPRYGEYVLAERARLGANNPVYLSQYELTASRGVDLLFDADQLAALQGDHPLLGRPAPGERYAAGLDIGGGGEDATVLTVARVIPGPRVEVVAWVRWTDPGFTTFAGRVARLAGEWQLERLAIDATGLGAPLAAQVAAEVGKRALPVVFSAQEKSALGWALVAAAGSGRLALPAGDGSREWTQAVAELGSCRRELRAGGLLGWHAPAGAHDDYVASLALCLRAAESLGPPRVATGRKGA